MAITLMAATPEAQYFFKIFSFFLCSSYLSFLSVALFCRVKYRFWYFHSIFYPSVPNLWTTTFATYFAVLSFH